MGVRLTDLHPEWIDSGGRKGVGVAFDCLVGSHNGEPCRIRLWILFANPLDGGPALSGDSRQYMPDPDDWLMGCGTNRWRRTGNSFESLSMTPSVNAHRCGHLTLTNGVFG